MLKKLLIIAASGMLFSGCVMAPLALLGPASSGFTTASIMQSGITSGTNFIVKKRTGRSIAQHILADINKKTLVKAVDQTLQQSFMPPNDNLIKYRVRKYRK